MSANNPLTERAFPALFLLFLGLFVLLLCSSSGSSANTRAEFSVVVEEDYELRFPTFTSISVTGEYGFHSVVFDEDELSSEQLRQLYQNGSAQDQENIEEYLEGEVEGYLYNVLGTTFQKTADPVINLSVERDTLADANYSGPVRLQGWGVATLTTENYGLDENLSAADIQDVLTGVFTMGAVPELDIDFNAPGGHSRNVKVFPPTGTGFLKESFGYELTHPAYLQWETDNTTGDKAPESGTVYLKSTDPNPMTEERIDVEIVVDWTEFDSTQIRVVLNAYSLDISKYSELSDQIHGLQYISASGVRMALDENLGDWDVEQLKRETAENATEEIEDILSDSLEQDFPIHLDFDWNDTALNAGYNPTTMSSSPPLRAELKSDPVVPNLYAIQDIFDVEDMDVVLGFLNAGARADFDIDGMSFGSEYNPSITLVLPENMRFKDTDTTEGMVGNRYSYSWDPAEGISGKIVSTTATEYTSNRIELDGELDFKKFEVDFFALEESSLSTEFSGQLRFHQFKLTDVIAKLLPIEVDIDYLNADILRLVFDKGLVDMDEIMDMLQTETRTYEEKFSKSIGEDIYINIKIVKSSLEESYDLNNMQGQNPIHINGKTSVDIPLGQLGESEEGMGRGGAFFEIKRFDFDFELPYLTGWEVNLKVIFPKGIEIVDVSDDDNNVARTTEGGRDAVIVTIDGQKNHVYFTIAITPSLIYETCQIPIFVIVGLFILYRYNKGRRKAKEARREEEAMLQESQGAIPQDQIVGLQGQPGMMPPPAAGPPMGMPPPGPLPSLGQPPMGQQPPPPGMIPPYSRGMPPLGGGSMPPLTPPDGKKK